MKENFLTLVKEIDIQVQQAQRVPNKMDPRRSTPRHILIKIKNNLQGIYSRVDEAELNQ